MFRMVTNCSATTKALEPVDIRSSIVEPVDTIEPV